MDKNTITKKTWNKYAKEYQDKFMDMDLYYDTYDLFCTLIEKKNAEVFEIACGPGNITRYLLTKRPDFNILGIDLASNMIDLAKINNPEADFQLMDCREIGKVDKKYDAIMCGFCLPYLSREESEKLISDVSGLLKLNGVLYLSTMEDDNDKSGFEGSSFGGEEKMYINYHQADYLTKALKKNGFEIINLQRIEYPEQNGTFTTDLIIMAKKIIQ
jgi:2-polyprenyl-3-methyl-5-hydroxy-6-metoxy-1,4-benzoquinol methylase